MRAGLGRFGDVRAPALPIRQGEAVALLAPMIAPGDIVVGHSMGGVVAQLSGARVELQALVVTGCFFPPARNGHGLGRSLADYAGHRVAYVRAAAAARGTGRELAPGSMRVVGPRLLVHVVSRVGARVRVSAGAEAAARHLRAGPPQTWQHVQRRLPVL